MIFSRKRVIAGITWDRFKFKSVYHGSESVSFLGPKIWNMLPIDWKDVDNLHTFKNKFKKWKDENWKGSVKFTLTAEKRSLEKKKSLGHSSNIFGIMAVAYQYRFATNKYKLPFLTFLTVNY